MLIKTARDVISPLRGAAFRRLTCDGRCWWEREIHTLTTLSRRIRPVAPGRPRRR